MWAALAFEIEMMKLIIRKSDYLYFWGPQCLLGSQRDVSEYISYLCFHLFWLFSATLSWLLL